MSTYAFRCPKTGLVEFVDTPGVHGCPFCRGQHQTYQIGPPTPEPGHPQVKPPFKHHYSNVHGQKLNSWSDLKAADKRLGLIQTGEKPQTNAPKHGTTTVAMS